MEHKWENYFDTDSEYWEKVQKIYKENDHFPKIVVSGRNLHHKFMRSFSKLEGTPIDNDKDNLVSLSEGDHLLVHWLLWKCTLKGYRTRTANAVRLMYRKSLKYLSLETVEMIAKDWQIINHRKVSKESKKKMSNSLKGKKFSEEHKEKISKSLKGKPKSEEHKSKLRGENNGMYGKHHSEEARKKMSKAWDYDKIFTEETRKKISEANKGKHHSEDAKRKMAKAHKGKKMTKETKNKMSEIHKGRHWYNNGKIAVFVYDCPQGFVKGRS